VNLGIFTLSFVAPFLSLSFASLSILELFLKKVAPFPPVVNTFVEAAKLINQPLIFVTFCLQLFSHFALAGL